MGGSLGFPGEELTACIFLESALPAAPGVCAHLYTSAHAHRRLSRPCGGGVLPWQVPQAPARAFWGSAGPGPLCAVVPYLLGGD